MTLDALDGDGAGLSGPSFLPDDLGRGFEDPPEHVRVGVLGQQVQDEPISDVANIHQLVQRLELLDAERSRSGPEKIFILKKFWVKFGFFHETKSLQVKVICLIVQRMAISF